MFKGFGCWFSGSVLLFMQFLQLQGITLPETNIAPEKKAQIAPKGNNRVPTLDFQVLLLVATRNPANQLIW